MATLSTLQEKVKKALLPDITAFGTTDITAYLNEGVNRIAAGIAMYEGVLSPPLPELHKTAKVNTVVIADATTIAFVDGGASADTITDSDSAFVTSGFAAGMLIHVSGSLNNDESYHSLATVAAGTITLVSTDELTAESAGEEVTIKSPCVALPSDYGRGLFYVSSGSQDKRIQVFDSFHKLLRKYPLLDEDGDVAVVAVKGDLLYYQPMPTTAEPLTLHYYRVPTEMSASDSTPDGVPSHLHERLLVNYAAKEILGMVEQSTKGKTLRSEKFEEKFQKAMGDLLAFIGPEDKEPIYYESDAEDGYY